MKHLECMPFGQPLAESDLRTRSDPGHASLLRFWCQQDFLKEIGMRDNAYANVTSLRKDNRLMSLMVTLTEILGSFSVLIKANDCKVKMKPKINFLSQSELPT